MSQYTCKLCVLFRESAGKWSYNGCDNLSSHSNASSITHGKSLRFWYRKKEKRQCEFKTPRPIRAGGVISHCQTNSACFVLYLIKLSAGKEFTFSALCLITNKSKCNWDILYIFILFLTSHLPLAMRSLKLLLSYFNLMYQMYWYVPVLAGWKDSVQYFSKANSADRLYCIEKTLVLVPPWKYLKYFNIKLMFENSCDICLTYLKHVIVESGKPLCLIISWYEIDDKR